MKYVIIALAVACAAPAHAAESTYAFTGTLNSVGLFANEAAWPFRTGQQFSGTLVYDPARITSSYDAISNSTWTMTVLRSPIVAFSYAVEFDGGVYRYDVPTQDLTNAAWQYAAAGRGTGGWNGIDIRTMNYPVGWTAGPPSAPVPPAAFIGSLNPHAAFLSISTYGDPSVMSDTSGDVDLAALFQKTGSGMFAARFSNSYAWTSGMERLDGVIGGNLDSIVKITAAVPEPANWALLIAGFGAIGASLRLRRAVALVG